jgi:23S rRNA (adenine2503-C2)-methyltransferase
MAQLRLLKIAHSRVDRTVKCVMESRGQVVEFSFIDKKDRKDIICVPSQTSCRLGCRFCHLTGLDIPVRNLTGDEILAGVEYVTSILALPLNGAHRCLLISFMGCGEPLNNLKGVMEACEMIRKAYSGKYGTVRFAVASLIPSLGQMTRFIDEVAVRKLAVKFHWSLHSTSEFIRREMMPAASPIWESLRLVERFMAETGNKAEIHYALIDGVNDTDSDIQMLVRHLRGRGISVKFLAYNEKPGLEFQRSQRLKAFQETLGAAGIETEYYLPPGSDIGSSCGQFLTDYYKVYSIRKK